MREIDVTPTRNRHDCEGDGYHVSRYPYSRGNVTPSNHEIGVSRYPQLKGNVTPSKDEIRVSRYPHSNGNVTPSNDEVRASRYLHSIGNVTPSNGQVGVHFKIPDPPSGKSRNHNRLAPDVEYSCKFDRWKPALTEDGKLCIKGRVKGIVNYAVLISEPVARRINKWLVAGNEGVFRLGALQNSDLPPYISEKFKHGFPLDWVNVGKAWFSFVEQGEPEHFTWIDGTTESPDLENERNYLADTETDGEGNIGDFVISSDAKTSTVRSPLPYPSHRVRNSLSANSTSPCTFVPFIHRKRLLEKSRLLRDKSQENYQETPRSSYRGFRRNKSLSFYASLSQEEELFLNESGKLRSNESPDIPVDGSFRKGIKSSSTPFVKGNVSSKEQINTELIDFPSGNISISPGDLVHKLTPVTGAKDQLSLSSINSDLSFNGSLSVSSVPTGAESSLLNTPPSSYRDTGLLDRSSERKRRKIRSSRICCLTGCCPEQEAQHDVNKKRFKTSLLVNKPLSSKKQQQTSSRTLSDGETHNLSKQSSTKRNWGESSYLLRSKAHGEAGCSSTEESSILGGQKKQQSSTHNSSKRSLRKRSPGESSYLLRSRARRETGYSSTEESSVLDDSFQPQSSFSRQKEKIVQNDKSYFSDSSAHDMSFIKKIPLSAKSFQKDTLKSFSRMNKEKITVEISLSRDQDSCHLLDESDYSPLYQPRTPVVHERETSWQTLKEKTPKVSSETNTVTHSPDDQVLKIQLSEFKLSTPKQNISTSKEFTSGKNSSFQKEVLHLSESLKNLCTTDAMNLSLRLPEEDAEFRLPKELSPVVVIQKLDQQKLKILSSKPKLLCDWTPVLIPLPKPRICLKGQLKGPSGRLRMSFHVTKMVLERLSSNVVKTSDGQKYKLIGPASNPSGQIPLLIYARFQDGIPRDWESDLLEWKNELNTLAKKKQHSLSTPSSSRGDTSVDSHTSSLDTVRDIAGLSRSTRGRIRMPRLSFWLGERVSQNKGVTVYEYRKSSSILGDLSVTTSMTPGSGIGTIQLNEELQAKNTRKQTANRNSAVPVSQSREAALWHSDDARERSDSLDKRQDAVGTKSADRAKDDNSGRSERSAEPMHDDQQLDADENEIVEHNLRSKEAVEARFTRRRSKIANSKLQEECETALRHSGNVREKIDIPDRRQYNITRTRSDDKENDSWRRTTNLNNSDHLEMEVDEIQEQSFDRLRESNRQQKIVNKHPIGRRSKSAESKGDAGSESALQRSGNVREKIAAPDKRQGNIMRSRSDDRENNSWRRTGNLNDSDHLEMEVDEIQEQSFDRLRESNRQQEIVNKYSTGRRSRSAESEKESRRRLNPQHLGRARENPNEREVAVRSTRARRQEESSDSDSHSEMEVEENSKQGLERQKITNEGKGYYLRRQMRNADQKKQEAKHAFTDESDPSADDTEEEIASEDQKKVERTENFSGHVRKNMGTEKLKSKEIRREQLLHESDSMHVKSSRGGNDVRSFTDVKRRHCVGNTSPVKKNDRFPDKDRKSRKGGVCRAAGSSEDRGRHRSQSRRDYSTEDDDSSIDIPVREWENKNQSADKLKGSENSNDRNRRVKNALHYESESCEDTEVNPKNVGGKGKARNQMLNRTNDSEELPKEKHKDGNMAAHKNVFKKPVHVSEKRKNIPHKKSQREHPKQKSDEGVELPSDESSGTLLSESKKFKVPQKKVVQKDRFSKANSFGGRPQKKGPAEAAPKCKPLTLKQRIENEQKLIKMREVVSVNNDFFGAPGCPVGVISDNQAVATINDLFSDGGTSGRSSVMSNAMTPPSTYFRQLMEFDILSTPARSPCIEPPIYKKNDGLSHAQRHCRDPVIPWTTTQQTFSNNYDDDGLDMRRNIEKQRKMLSMPGFEVQVQYPNDDEDDDESDTTFNNESVME